jgi:hypothetical protein
VSVACAARSTRWQQPAALTNRIFPPRRMYRRRFDDALQTALAIAVAKSSAVVRHCIHDKLVNLVAEAIAVARANRPSGSHEPSGLGLASQPELRSFFCPSLDGGKSRGATKPYIERGCDCVVASKLGIDIRSPGPHNLSGR